MPPLHVLRKLMHPSADRLTYDHFHFEENNIFKTKAQTTGPRTVCFASLLNKEEGPLAQWPSRKKVERCPGATEISN